MICILGDHINNGQDHIADYTSNSFENIDSIKQGLFINNLYIF